MRFLRGAIALLCAPLLCLSLFAQGLAATGNGGFWQFGTISATGQLGAQLTFMSMPAAPSKHTLEWSVTGTAPTACTLQLEGSTDTFHWYSLTGAQSCTSSQMVHIVDKPVPYVRANVLTYTAGDGTTQVSVRYIHGS